MECFETGVEGRIMEAVKETNENELGITKLEVGYEESFKWLKEEDLVEPRAEEGPGWAASGLLEAEVSLEEGRGRRLERGRRADGEARASEAARNALARRRAREDPEYRRRERERDRIRRREKRKDEEYRRRERERERVRRRKIRESRTLLGECLSFATHFLLLSSDLSLINLD